MSNPVGNPFAGATWGGARGAPPARRDGLGEDAAVPLSVPNPFAGTAWARETPSFADVEGGASTAPRPAPGVVRRSLDVVEQGLAELKAHPFRTVGRVALGLAEGMVQPPLDVLQSAVTPIAGLTVAQQSPIVRYGHRLFPMYLPQVLPDSLSPGTVVTKANTPGALTPRENLEQAVAGGAGTAALLGFGPLARTVAAPLERVLAPVLADRLATALVGAGTGAALGALNTPKDRPVGATLGGVLGGVAGLALPVRGPRVPGAAEIGETPPEGPVPGPAPRPGGPPASPAAPASPAGPPRAASFDDVIVTPPPARPVLVTPPPDILTTPAPDAAFGRGLPPGAPGGIRALLAPPEGPVGALPRTQDQPGRLARPFDRFAGDERQFPPPSALPPLAALAPPVAEPEAAAVPEAVAPGLAARGRPPVPAVVGHSDLVRLGAGAQVPVTYGVVEAADLRPSHDAFSFAPAADYPAGVQARRYERNPDAQLLVDQGAQRLDPARLLRETGTADGPPIVTPGGTTVVGNQRTMMIQRAAAMHPAQFADYRDDLLRRADQFGVDRAAVAAMRAPVLVRVAPALSEADPARLRAVNAASDVPAQKAMTGLDAATSRAGALMQAPGALDHLAATLDPDQTLHQYLTSPAGREFVVELGQAGVIAPHELAAIRDPATGALTPGGRVAVAGMLQHAAVGDPLALADAPPAVQRQIEHAIPALLRTAGTPFDLSADVAQALDLLTRVAAHREAGQGIRSVADLTGQGDLLGPRDAPSRGETLARVLEGRSPRATTEAFRRYGQLATEAIRQQAEGADLFGASAITPAEAFARAFGAEPSAVVREPRNGGYARGEDRVAAAPAAGGLPLGPGAGSGGAESAAAPPGEGPGRGAGGLPPAGVGGDVGAAGVEEPAAFGAAVAETARRLNPRQAGLSQIEQAAVDLARVARETPDEALRVFGAKVPGLVVEPYSRTVLAALRREARVRPLTGQTVRSARDLAVAMQVYRDPRWETFRVVYVRGGRVALAEAMGARAGDGAESGPGGAGRGLDYAYVHLPEGADATYDHVAAEARRVGADGVYLVHNHPSGAPEPSAEDRAITAGYVAGLRARGIALRAHVIINDRSYSRIAPGGGTRTYPLAASAARRIRRPSGPVIRGPTEAAGVAIAIKGAQTDPGAVLLLHLDSQAAVRAVQDLPLGDLVAGPDAVRRFERAARQVGSARVIAAVTDGVTASRLEQALGTHLLDIVTIRPRGSFVSEAAAGSRLGGNPPGGAEAEAAEARQTLQRVRESPGPDYGSGAEAPPLDEAAWRGAASHLDWGGQLQQALDGRSRGSLSDRIGRLADALSNQTGPLERLGREAEAANPLLPPGQNVAHVLALAKSSDYTVERAIREGVPDPVDRTRLLGPSYAGLFAPFGRNDREIVRALTYAVSKRIVGRGISAVGGDAAWWEDANVVVREGDRIPAYRAFGQRLAAYTDALVAYAERSGLFTEEQARALRGSDLLYIPFQRLVDALSRAGARGPGGRGYVNVTPGVQDFTGSVRDIRNVAVALAEYTRSIIHRADAARVAGAFFSTLDALGERGAALATPIPDPRPAALRHGALAALVDAGTPRDPLHPEIWRTRPDGSREYRRLNVPDLYDALTSLRAEPGEVTRFLDRALLPLRRMFTATTTALVPRFATASNPARDIPAALLRSRHGATLAEIAAGYAQALAATVPAAGRQAALARLGRALAPLGVTLPDDPGAVAALEAVRAHGLGNTSYYGQPRSAAAIAHRYAPTTRAQVVTGAIHRLASAPLGALEHVLDASDLGPRAGEAAATLGDPAVLARAAAGGWTASDLRLLAASEGRVVTNDFWNQPGNAVLRAFGRYAPFVRPALQDPIRTAEAARRRPGAFAVWALGASAAAIAAWVWNHRNPAAAAAVDDRNDVERASYLLFTGPGDAPRIGRLPVGQEMGVILAGTTALMDAWVAQDPHAAGPFVQALLRALPPGVDEWVQGQPELPIPGLQQIQENDRNRRFFGNAPVVPERLQGLPAAEQRLPGTPLIYSVLGNATGVAPLKARNLARGFLSQAEPVVARALDAPARAVLGGDAPVYSPAPLRASPLTPLSALVAPDPSYRSASEDRYYAARARLAEAGALVRVGERTDDPRLLLAGRATATPAADAVFAETDRTLAALGDRQDAIYRAARAGTLAGADLRAALDAITLARQAAFRDAMARLDALPR